MSILSAKTHAEMDEPVTPRGQKIQLKETGVPPPPRKAEPKKIQAGLYFLGMEMPLKLANE